MGNRENGIANVLLTGDNSGGLGLRVYCLLYLLFLTCLLPGALKAAESPALIYHIQTKHYSIETTVSKEFTLELADHMEEIYGEYRSRLSLLFGGKMNVRFNVTVFRTEGEYVAALGPNVKGSTGIFSPQLQLLAGWLGERPRQQLFRTLYHEGFHQFVFFYISRECPIWLNEGMAEYFSEATWNGRRFKIGEVPPERLAVLRSAIQTGNAIPLKNLMNTSSDQWGATVRNDRSGAMLQYNEAWSLVHFLIHGAGGRLRPKFVKYVKRVKAGGGNYESFTECFGTNFRALEKGWRKYVMKLKASPKYVCMMRMRGLCALVGQSRRHSESVGSMEDLYKLLKRSRWQVLLADGTKFESGDKDDLDKLMHCPADRGRGVSYRLKKLSRTGGIEIVCNHHKGTRIIGRVSADGREVDVIEHIPTKSTGSARRLAKVKVKRKSGFLFNAPR